MGYYRAGGFFKRFVHAAARVGQAIVKANTKPYAFLMSGGKTTDIKAAAIMATQNAIAVTGAGGAAGRIAAMLPSPPAGVPTDGTPPLGPIHTLASHNDGEHAAAAHAVATHRKTHRRPVAHHGRLRSYRTAYYRRRRRY